MQATLTRASDTDDFRLRRYPLVPKLDVKRGDRETERMSPHSHWRSPECHVRRELSLEVAKTGTPSAVLT